MDAPNSNYNTPRTQPQHSNDPSQQNNPPTKPSGSVGPLVGAATVVVLLIVGGLYLWGAQLNKQGELNEENVFDTSQNDSIAPASDEPGQIESDLESFSSAEFEAQLEADLQALESDL